MKQSLLAFFTLCFFVATSQNEFYNSGADIYIQKGALIHVQGSVVNSDGSGSGAINNDGIIEVKGDFENQSGAELKVYTDNTSTDRAVKFVGSGTQAIKGDLNSSGSAGFFNLVIDKAVSSDIVDVQTNLVVEGSLVFGNNSTSTYIPSFTNPGNRGIVDLDGFLLDVQNSNIDAVKGHDIPAMNNTATTGFILVNGTKTNVGGLQRKVTPATYEFPIATTVNGYNPTRINFSSVHAGGSVKAKFNDVTGTGLCFATIGYEYVQFPISPQSPVQADNNGFNYYFANNPCNSGNKQWIVLEDAVTDHGYWSLEGSGTSSSYVYDLETFPTGYADAGNASDLTRTIKYSGPAYDADASPYDWTPQIRSSVSNINDLMTYTRNAGCYSGLGVPGGVYTGFSHFGIAKSKSASALPVELIYLQANPIDNSYIKVSWATAIEINNSGFEVQRSTDGANFSNIGWVAGNNNSTTTLSYHFDDMNVAPNVVYYYRLRQVDNDGQSELTYIVSAMITDGETFTISEFIPNPTQDFSKLVFTTSTAQDINIKLYDIIGQVVMDKNYSLSVGQTMVDFETQNLAGGTYTAAIAAQNLVFSKRLIVAN